jgi:hypothetical protein
LFKGYNFVVCSPRLTGGDGAGQRAGWAYSVRYGISPFQDTLLPILGQEFGWYEEEGLDVEFVIGWTEVQEARGREVNVAVNNETSVITHENFNRLLVRLQHFHRRGCTDGASRVRR